MDFPILDEIAVAIESIHPDAGGTLPDLSHHDQTSPVSKSKRPPVHCPMCKRTCGRLQELHRHILSVHLPCWLHCPYRGCTWRGHRKEDFKVHSEVHPDSNNTQLAPCHVYESKLVLDWLMDGSIPAKMVVTFALDFVAEKAHELGFVEQWKDLWGRRGKRSRRRRGE